MEAKCWKCGAMQPQTFGEWVKACRGDRTAKAFAEEVGLHASTIGRIENGEFPDMRTFVTLVQAMGVEPAFAFDLVRKQIAAATDAEIHIGGAAVNTSAAITSQEPTGDRT